MSASNFLHNKQLQASMVLVQRRLWRPFLDGTRNPQSHQDSLLKEIIGNQAETTFGQDHRFKVLRGYQEFRLEVPIQTYEDLRAYIQTQEETKEPRINANQPVGYAVTSGTTGKPKFIPLLPQNYQLLEKYQQLSICGQYQGIPEMFDGKLLVLAGSAVEGHLETGTPYGSMSGLLADALPAVVQQKRIAFPSMSNMENYQLKYFYIAAWALAEPHLSAIAAANPSTLLKMLEMGRQKFPQLVEFLTSGKTENGEQPDVLPRISRRRLKELRAFVGKEQALSVEALWPDLRAVVTWTGGNCGVLIPQIEARISKETAIVEMGYLSSEFLGSVNVDVRENRCVPTYDLNFFEFVEQEDWDSGRPNARTLEQLEVGKRYYVIVTTANGLFRYFINDLIEVTGHYHRTPVITFLQKGRGVTNLTGEKLYEYHVMEAIDHLQKTYHIKIEFFVMVADPFTLQYTLYVEHPPLDFFAAYKLEQHISQTNLEYRAKKDSGRLQPLRLIFLQPGTSDAYKRYCVQQGQREDQFKVVRLQYAKDCTFDFMKYVRE